MKIVTFRDARMHDSHMKIRLYFLLFLILAPSAALAAPKVAVSVGDNAETITLSVPETEPHNIFTLSNPDRLVVDVPGFATTAEEKRATTLPKSYSGELIRRLRFGRFDADTSRFVFDLAQPVKIEAVNVDTKKHRLRVEIRQVEARQQAKRYKKPVVVIDPGHGGVDPGASAPGGMQEKDIVLDYAQALEAKLVKAGKYDVVLTRDDDTFIKLRDRIEIARKAGADVFISLHADSAPDNVRGLSVYTLSEKSSDEEAEALAARENKSDVLAGVDLSDERQDVAGILISLAQRDTMNRSAMLADLMVIALGGKVKLLQHSHRFAGFAVLKSPEVPSILIELGFLSHHEDRKLLASRAYRDKVTSGIAAGIDAYFRRKKKAGGE